MVNKISVKLFIKLLNSTIDKYNVSNKFYIKYVLLLEIRRIFERELDTINKMLYDCETKLIKTVKDDQKNKG